MFPNFVNLDVFDRRFIILFAIGLFQWVAVTYIVYYLGEHDV